MRAQVPFSGTPAEVEAYTLYENRQLITARTKSEEVLRANDASIVGHYVLGCALREAEGSLAQAMQHLGRARELYEGAWGTSRRAGAPWQLHREILYAIQQLAGEMEEYEYQLQILDFYDSLYDPVLTAEHAWPLLHLGRFQAAREAAQRATRMQDPFQRSLGLNALCAISSEAREREAGTRDCTAALVAARARRAASDATDPESAPSLTVHAYNAAMAAWGALNHAEAERLAQEGARRLEFTTANPHRLLTRLYVDEGRFDAAIAEIDGMRSWRARQPAHLRDQDHADSDATLAIFMLAANEDEVGLTAIDRAILRPDRRGLTDTRVENTLGAHALIRRALTRLKAELDEEAAAREPFLRRVTGAFGAFGTRLSSFPDDERVRGVLGDRDRLIATLRFHVSGGLEPMPTWLVGDLIDVLGAGVVAAALEEARRADRGFLPIRGYFEAIEAELRFREGDDDKALARAAEAWTHLPATEALLAARVAVIAARAAEELDRGRDALSWWERALQKDPGALRRMGAALPAQVRGVGGGMAEEAATMIARSPRFRDARGFEVVVETLGPALRTCFRSPSGALLSCTTVQPEVRTPEREGAPPPPPETETERAQHMQEEFLRVAFGPKLTGPSVDLRSLDGSTLPSETHNREQLQHLLEAGTE